MARAGSGCRGRVSGWRCRGSRRWRRFRRGGGGRRRGWQNSSADSVKRLSARDVIRRENFLVAHDGIHHGGNVLTASVRMAKAERVSHFVKKNAPNVGDGRAV